MKGIPSFQDISHRAASWPYGSGQPSNIYCSTCNCWVVQVFKESSGAIRVGIRKSRKSDPREAVEIIESWSFIYAIKERFFPGRLAIEVFPAPDEVVNAAPMRWLYVLPKGMKLPFNLSGKSDELVT